MKKLDKFTSSSTPKRRAKPKGKRSPGDVMVDLLQVGDGYLA